MDDLLSNEFKESAVQKINLCRLFLQVESLAEICDPPGNCILDSVWKGKRPHLKSKCIWPKQDRPHEPSWQIWRRFLKLAYLHPDKQNANSRRTDLRLEQPLGPWIGDSQRRSRIFRMGTGDWTNDPLDLYGSHLWTGTWFLQS